MHVKRTFHPVGQGAFYSEDIVFDNGKSYCVVYDCGSKSTGFSLENYITKTFEKVKIIDILFISHLHADHINGINALKRHCHIRSVVMPFIKEQDKIMLKFANLQDVNRQQAGDFDFDMLIDNPIKFFNDSKGERTRIIRVANMPSADVRDDKQKETKQKKSSYRSLNTMLKSKYKTSILRPNQKLLLGKESWIYILINHRQEERIQQFKDALRNNNLVLPQNITIDFYTNNEAILRKIYEAVDGDLNSNSLIVYSGQDSCCYDKGSCLYTGDADFKRNGLIDQVNYTLSDCKHKINVVQVPHHGSRNSWKDDIMNLNPECENYVISHGIANRYGHPACEVLQALQSKGKQVTEKPESIYIQVLSI